MERYGPATTEGSQSDPSPEWTTTGPETGLEDPMWELGLGGVELPQADCTHYLRTGLCAFGSRCRFNHPRDRGAVIGAARPGGGEYPERVGQPVCQYYMKTGTCKFGASCKFHHPRQGEESVTSVSLNYYGYPLRPGEKDCSYYLKTGHCKFGATCKFHHPQPAGTQAPTVSLAPSVAAAPAPTLYPDLQSPSVPSTQQYGIVVARPPLPPGSYVQSPYGPFLVPPSMVPFPGWSTYSAPISPVPSPGTQPAVGSGYYGIAHVSPPTYNGIYQSLPSFGPSSSSQKEQSFPERPGQPECHYYMKTGDCKFGSSCRYHHPPELIAPKTNVLLGPNGLPLRPGAPPCTHYAQRGVCKFGPACKYDHSMGTLSYSPSASSLADIPVAPYPVGSSIGTLAPSFSSSELRPELVSGSSKDSVSSRMSSSMSASTGSVGSTFSKSGSVPHSAVQPSAQGSGPSAGSSSGSSEARTSN